MPEPLKSTITTKKPVDLTGALLAESALSVDIKSSPWVVLFGACIGGVLSYLLLWLAGGRGTVAESPKLLAMFIARIGGLASAAIVAGVVTILLQRVGNTTFLVTVGVNDFWGAIVVGFLAQYAGIRVLDRFVDTERRRTAAATSERASATVTPPDKAAPPPQSPGPNAEP